MPVVLLLVVLLGLPLPGWNQETDTNVNSRYTVESVELPPKVEGKLSDALKLDISKIIGSKFNQETVDRLSKRIRKELAGYLVLQKITKGASPESIKIVYQVVRGRHQDVVLPRLVYHSKENFSFGADAETEWNGNRFSVGIVTDNDQLVERFSGVRGGFLRTVLDGRVRAGVQIESWRAQWNSAVEQALAAEPHKDVPGIYRTRLHVNPGVTVEVLPGLTVGAGVSLNRFQTQYPAARFESANVLATSLRLSRQFEPSNLGRHFVEAGYHLRAATSALGTDYHYTRHTVDLAYTIRGAVDGVTFAFTAGRIGGQAPLFERYVLGNSRTLRGYNKYDVAPLGGTRMAHGSIDYRHRWVRLVYDTGTVHDRGGAKVRHSVAAGLTSGFAMLGKDSLSLLVAFPLKDGRAEPIFIVGMNF